MKYILAEYKVVDVAHWIEASLELEPGESPNSNCPFFKNAMDVVNINSFELDPTQTSINVYSAGLNYSIPIEMILAIENDGETAITDPTFEQVYDFFAIAKGYL